jgi:general stress protein 26
MDKQEIINAVQALMRAGVPFVYATSGADGVPHVRWMGASYVEDPLTVYLVCGTGSRKLSQISGNATSQLMFHSPDFSRVATLTGRSEAVDDLEIKRRIYENVPQLAEYFSGHDDPKLALIRFTSAHVEMIGLSEGMKVDVAEL